MVRPSTGAPVLVRIPADLLDLIDHEADAADISRAEQIRRLLRKALECT